MGYTIVRLLNCLRLSIYTVTIVRLQYSDFTWGPPLELPFKAYVFNSNLGAQSPWGALPDEYANFTQSPQPLIHSRAQP